MTAFHRVGSRPGALSREGVWTGAHDHVTDSGRSLAHPGGNHWPGTVQLPPAPGRFNRPPRAGSTTRPGHGGGVVAWAPAYLGAEPDQRIVLAAHHALLHRDQRVVGDLDVLRADLGAALGDVAVAEAEVVLGDLPAVRGVGRVHLQFGDPHQEPGAGERALVVGMVTDHVADVLTQEALDALAEL